MKILWLTWKDRKNPLAGGAEAMNEELARRLARDGHEVTFLVAGFPGGSKEERVDGFRVIRLGTRITVYWHAYQYYRKHLVGWADLVLDEINTIPFFAHFYVKEKNILVIYMLCRQIWFYQIVFPLSLIGYLLEPFYIWLLRKERVVTISESTKKDLVRYGFKKGFVNIISVGIETEPVRDLGQVAKFESPTILSFGAIRAMKRTDHQIRAFEIAKEKIKDLKLIMAGDSSGSYGRAVLSQIESSPYAKDIEYLGKVDRDQKALLMQKAHLILVTSVKEGWGLVVTEAASQGTPAVVYNVDGLRDSVRDGQTGLLCQAGNPAQLAEKVVELLKNKEKYELLRRKGFEWSKGINFEKSYFQFKQILKL